MHTEKSNIAGKEVKIKASVTHPQNPNFGGSFFRVEDWWDHLTGGSWMNVTGNLACLVYAMRISFTKESVPLDDDVLYGHTSDGYCHLVHINEIEELERGKK